MRNSVLLVSAFDSTFTPALKNAFTYLTYRVEVYDYRNVSKNIFRYLVNAWSIFSFIKAVVNSKGRYDFLNKQLILTCKKIRPHYVFVVKGETIDNKTIQAINALGCRTIIWQVDATFHPKIWAYIQHVGRFYTNYVACEPEPVVTKLKKLGFKKVHYMLGAADQFAFRKETPEHLKKYDVVLVGSFDELREKYMSALHGLPVFIWGWGDWKGSKVSKMYQGSPVTQTQMLDIYAQAKIVINVGRNPTSPIPTNLRPFEAAQVGAFILVDYTKTLHTAFKIGKEIDTFKTAQELRRKVEYYLKHPKKREEIAHNMRVRVLKEHTYVHRLKHLIAQINASE